jgi:hypothetical protein
MDKAQAYCAELKAQYDECFKAWYKAEIHEKSYVAESCTDQFEEYRDCVQDFFVNGPKPKTAAPKSTQDNKSE